MGNHELQIGGQEMSQFVANENDPTRKTLVTVRPDGTVKSTELKRNIAASVNRSGFRTVEPGSRPNQ